MKRNYAIGIGGSGAKAVEALIHLCACGLGPDDLTLALMDPDDANGNQRRTLDTLESYGRARASIYRPGESQPGETCRFLKTELAANAADLCWSPLPSGINTMHELFCYDLMNDDQTTFINAFYLDDEEQRMPLHEGFRGRPSVGAAVLGALASADDPYWAELLQAATMSKQGGEVRVFLVGSIFGGTGAAGFPVVARMLRDHIREQKVKKSVRLSGALFLPYFSYPAGPSSATAVAANPNVFLAKAQQALDYYQSLMSDTPVFDDLYLIGWPRIIPCPERHEGGKDQCNPPLLPELYGAFAAADFFGKGASAAGVARAHQAPGRVFQIAVGEADQLAWHDLPAVSTNDRRSAKETLGQAIRFAYAYSRVYARELARKRLKSVLKERWYRLNLALEEAVARSDREQEAISALSAYCERLLRYLMTVSRSEAGGGGMQVRLFDNTGFVGAALHTKDALLVSLDGGSREERAGFTTMVVGSEGRSLAEIRDNLSDRKRTANAPNVKGLGRLVTSLYAECALGATNGR